MTPKQQERLRREDAALLDLGRRGAAACVQLNRAELPPWERFVNGVRCFDKFRMDDLQLQHRRRFERAFSRMNTILSRYPIQTWADYRLISPADLDRLHALLKNV